MHVIEMVVCTIGCNEQNQFVFWTPVYHNSLKGDDDDSYALIVHKGTG